MKVYVASSWGNKAIHKAIDSLCAAGHECFRSIESIEDKYFALPLITKADEDKLLRSDVLVLLEPFGPGTPFELGLALGAGKQTFVVSASKQMPGHWSRLVQYHCHTIDEVIERLKASEVGDGHP